MVKRKAAASEVLYVGNGVAEDGSIKRVTVWLGAKSDIWLLCGPGPSSRPLHPSRGITPDEIASEISLEFGLSDVTLGPPASWARHGNN